MSRGNVCLHGSSHMFLFTSDGDAVLPVRIELIGHGQLQGPDAIVNNFIYIYHALIIIIKLYCHIQCVKIT